MHDWPAPGWVIHEVVPALQVQVVREMPALSTSVEAEIDRLWAAGLARTDGALFNGRVFNADEIMPDAVRGHWTEYRRVVAQIERPDFYALLAIRPLAVGGAIVGPDGVVIGKRPENAVYQPDMWQLPPAGSLDPGAVGEDGIIDIARQVLTELREELGMAAETVRILRPLCIVEHAGSHVADLGVALETSLGAAAIAAAHAQAADAEYDPLRVVPLHDLAEFVAATMSQAKLTPQAVVFLTRMGLLPEPFRG